MLIPAVQRLRIGLALGAIVIALAQQPQRQARAQIHRTQPRAALGGVLQYALLHVGDLWLGALRQASLPSSRILAL